MATEPIETKPSQLLTQLSSYFLIGSGAGVIYGIIHWAGILAEGYTPIRLADAVFNTLFGIVLFACWKLLSARKPLVIAVWGAIVVSSIIYALAVERRINIPLIVVETLIGAALVLLWRRREFE